MMKIAFIGAGSVGFTRKLVRDILKVPELQDVEFALHDISPRNLDMVARLLQRDVEANELPFGPAEVVVCDGFVGNVVMKLTEGLGQALSGHLRDALGDSLPAGELERLVNEMYELNNIVETWGGGPIFGVNGVSIVGHGRARRTAVKRAISTAKRAVDSQFVSELNEELASVRSRVESPPS